MKMNVDLIWEGTTWSLGQVEVSNNKNPKGRREENELFAMNHVHRIIGKVQEITGYARQPAFLYAVTLVVKTQYGVREHAAEEATIQRYFRHYGFDLRGESPA
jgi:hypothetical protein